MRRSPVPIQPKFKKMKFKVNKSLLPLKFVLFAYYGATACILPYLTVHMRQIGITVEETAIIYAALPVVGFLGPPIAGFFADRLGRYQPILLTTLVAVALFHTALLAIPPVAYKNNPVNVSLMCEQQRSIWKLGRCSQNEPCLKNISNLGVYLPMGQCFSATTVNNLLNESLTNDICLQGQVSKCERFHYNDDDDNITITLSNLQLISQSELFCDYELRSFTWNNKTFINMTCPSTEITCRNCSLTSVVDADGDADDDIKDRHIPVCKRFVGNHLLTFASYFVLRVIGGIFLSTTFALLDATCFAMIEKNDGEYGKQKLWSILATAIFSPITGFLIDQVTKTKGYVDYSPAFYVFDCLIICTILLSFRLKFQLNNSSSEKMITNLKLLLKQVEVVALLCMILVLGCMWGFLETFLFWYMLDLESPKYLLGLTVTIGSGVSIPIMFSAGTIVKKVGNITLLVCALGVYSVRMIGYSLIYNPWWSLVFESLEVLTINLMWVAAATYGNSIAPPGLTATMQGTMGGLHYGIGRGVGSFIGGLFMQHFGARLTFRIMGVTSATACIMALAYFVIYIRRSKKEKGHQKEVTTNGMKTRDDSQLQHFIKSDEANENESSI